MMRSWGSDRWREARLARAASSALVAAVLWSGAAIAATPAAATEPPTAASAHDDSVPAWARPVAPWPAIGPAVGAVFARLAADVAVARALAFLREDDERKLEATFKLTEIPAPPFGEAQRAAAFRAMLEAEGLRDARIDAEGNVIAVRKGTGAGPALVVSAHLDTVFPAGTDVKVRFSKGRYYAPGITDDTLGLAVLLSWLRALNASGIATVGDLVFVGTVGEEGNGDLRGAKAFFRDHPDIDGYVGIESIPHGAIIILSTASNRYEVTFTAPGGHSYGAFGEVPSAIHAMGRAIAKISEIEVPRTPRTTFNVGVVTGGRSVNTIAPDARMEIDMRSDDPKELAALEARVLGAVRAAAVEENQRWGTSSLQVAIKKIGSRPGGTTPPDSTIVQAGLAGLKTLGQRELLLVGASTDGAVPISLGIPAILVAPGGKLYGFHAIDESLDPTDGYKGAQAGLLTVLALVGVKDTTEPLLPLRR